MQAGTAVKYFTGAGTGIGTTSIPVPDTSVRSERHEYRYRTLIITNLVSSVQYGYRYRRYRCRLSYG